ncbi:MAG: ribosome maturation factor RimP [Tenericutes bacterium]|nr:ribosome maturation factor RimP [Mycoplasmatota bacterium]
MDLEKLKEGLIPLINEAGYELYDLKYTVKKKNSVLTVFIDRKEGIKVEDCILVTEKINPYIDELDPIKEEYFLEVSSAGAEKEIRTKEAILSEIENFVHIETDEQKVEGYLESFDGSEITLKVNNKIVKINYEEVNLIRLAIKF